MYRAYKEVFYDCILLLWYVDIGKHISMSHFLQININICEIENT